MAPLAFRLARGTFTIRLWPTLITLVMMTVLIGLGCWQIQRLHWKEGLIAEMQERMQEPAIDVGLSVIPPEDIPNLNYRPGRATGVFQNDHALYLNAISINGEGGYEVLTPFALDDGRVLLVNRGWMPYALKDKPESNDPEESLYRPQGSVTVSGILRLPPVSKPWGRPANQPDKNDWYWLDLPALTQAAGVKEFMPYVLEAADAPHDGSYPIGGQTRITLPNNHFGYALTWFGLAFALLVIYGIFSWQKPAKTEATKGPTESEEKPESP
jgi:surfeit locus 1 family protein